MNCTICGTEMVGDGGSTVRCPVEEFHNKRMFGTPKPTMSQSEEIKLLPCPKCHEATTYILRTQTDPWSYSCGACGLYIDDWDAARTPNESTKELLEDKARFEWACKHIMAFSDHAIEALRTRQDVRTAISNAMKQE